ncbi:MAG: hypothetical protein QOE03_2087, partial [Micromonosporaceae bacterium]|nr:hypothetical protein [Micromonosporaceae bacterium]
MTTGSGPRRRRWSPNLPRRTNDNDHEDAENWLAGIRPDPPATGTPATSNGVDPVAARADPVAAPICRTGGSHTPTVGEPQSRSGETRPQRLPPAHGSAVPRSPVPCGSDTPPPRESPPPTPTATLGSPPAASTRPATGRARPPDPAATARPPGLARVHRSDRAPTADSTAGMRPAGYAARAPVPPPTAQAAPAPPTLAVRPGVARVPVTPSPTASTVPPHAAPARPSGAATAGAADTRPSGAAAGSPGAADTAPSGAASGGSSGAVHRDPVPFARPAATATGFDDIMTPPELPPPRSRRTDDSGN